MVFTNVKSSFELLFILSLELSIRWYLYSRKQQVASRSAVRKRLQTALYWQNKAALELSNVRRSPLARNRQKWTADATFHLSG
ncbi:hypothetical protein DBZ36_09885 [Alginatibacterium sediminis]|uniref:Uncharacterized protein n=1 Tax=Alginatibacterium sediminis TaxID=2164068 RepID=A0A420EDF4_9ALTE|nr:hypothetical protein DBZ36_09885 [Alginatibacterium sediminis]